MYRLFRPLFYPVSMVRVRWPTRQIAFAVVRGFAASPVRSATLRLSLAQDRIPCSTSPPVPKRYVVIKQKQKRSSDLTNFENVAFG